MANIISTDLPKFNISAAVVRQLGEELVTDEVTAVMELVKNSYDADATWVKIDVNSTDSLSGPNYHFKDDIGYISISDNGFGMDESEIKTGWMVISLSGKRKMKAAGLKTPAGRTPLGDKGLGRLSTQRLGNRLEMFTSKGSDTITNHVAFDWNDFSEDVALTDVPTIFEQQLKQGTGTTLIIRNLREPDAWEGKTAAKFIGQLSQLIFPFKERREFHVFLTINGERIDLDELNEALRSQATSQFDFNFDGQFLTLSGYIKSYKLYGGANSSTEREAYQQLIVNDLGRNFYSFLTDKKNNRSNFLDGINYSGSNGIIYSFTKSFALAGMPEVSRIKKNEDEYEVANPGSFWGEIDDFNLREAETLDSAFDSFSQYKEIVKNQIGIRIFRNGFGIKPFGINGDDWLKLGSQQTTGGSYYTLRPNNTIGFVAITADGNKDLKEKTDREGFVDSPYSRNFFLIMNKIIDEINDLLERTRRSYNDYKRHVAQQTGNINDIKESYSRLQETSRRANVIQKDSKNISQSLERVSATVKEVILASRSTMPQSVAEQNNIHLLKDIDVLLDNAKNVLSQVNAILNVAKKLEHDANFIQPKVENLERQLTEFAELAGLGLTAEALSHEIANIVDKLLIQTNVISSQIKGEPSVETRSVNFYVEQVKGSIQAFRKQLSHLAPSLRYVREKKQRFSVRDYVDDLKSYYQARFTDQIVFDVVIANDFIINMSKGKLTQILDNLILNSEYWLKEKTKSDKNFKPKLVVEINQPFIRISDNGNGVDPAYEERLFQPFVTSKPKDVGRGLGLFIVQQLLDTVGADIILLGERNTQGNRYIFQINLSSITT